MQIQTINLNRNDVRRLERWIARRWESPDAEYHYQYQLEYAGKGLLKIEWTFDEMEPGPHAIAHNVMTAIGKTFDYELVEEA